MTPLCAVDPESVRMVLDCAYEELRRFTSDSPLRVAFDEVAAAVGWQWYPETDAPAGCEVAHG